MHEHQFRHYYIVERLFTHYISMLTNVFCDVLLTMQCFVIHQTLYIYIHIITYIFIPIPIWLRNYYNSEQYEEKNECLQYVSRQAIRLYKYRGFDSSRCMIVFFSSTRTTEPIHILLYRVRSILVQKIGNGLEHCLNCALLAKCCKPAVLEIFFRVPLQYNIITNHSRVTDD